MAVAAGDRLEAAGLECFDGCIFGFLTAHLKIGNLTIFADNQRVAEDGRIAKFASSEVRQTGEKVSLMMIT